MSQKVFALVDCNAFFCSCEILFRPELIGKPVGVLSNNDGCFVSRTKELKALGVKMGAPYFKVKDICDKNNVAVFSSNFSLYTNMSDRVMNVLKKFAPEIEIYSVDEAFLNIAQYNEHVDYAREIKRTVERHTGIPVSIGIGPTKTLAKIANHIAKRSKKARGVVSIMKPELQDIALSRVEVADIWGIGKASTIKLNQLGIKTAKDFRDYKNDRQIKKIFTKVGLKTKEELSGLSRFDLEMSPTKKQEIMCSRTFSKSVFDIDSLRESVANYATSVSEKLRKQGSVCTRVEVFMRTSPFKNVEQYYASDSTDMLSATADTRKIIKCALSVLESLYKEGYEYKKVGVRISNICDKNQAQMSLLEKPDDFETDNLMSCVDKTNRKEGGATLKLAICGTDNHSWRMNRQLKSPRYVSGWNQLRKLSASSSFNC